jgi:hypothetical protein
VTCSWSQLHTIIPRTNSRRRRSLLNHCKNDLKRHAHTPYLVGWHEEEEEEEEEERRRKCRGGGTRDGERLKPHKVTAN